LGDGLASRSAEFEMPWRQQKGSQEQRESFVKEAFRGEKPFGQLCREFRIRAHPFSGIGTTKCHPILRQSVTQT
jgi:hypothetical protein